MKIIDNFIDVICESAESSEQNLREALADDGFDYDTVAAEGVEFIKKFRKPKFWQCKTCCGLGSLQFDSPCQACDNTGMRWHWLRSLNKIIRAIPQPLLFNRCNDCKKTCWLLGFRIGDHDGCIPF